MEAALALSKVRVVLVVDDESFARLFAVQVLLDHGFLVLEADGAGDAIEMLADNSDISVLLTDINMPGPVDGLGLARHFRSVRPDINVILTSGCVLPCSSDTWGGLAFLPKPYSATALLNAVLETTAEPPPGTPEPISVKMLGLP